MSKIKHVQAAMFAQMILDNKDTSAIVNFLTEGKSSAYNLNGMPSGTGLEKGNAAMAGLLRQVADALETRDD